MENQTMSSQEDSKVLTKKTGGVTRHNFGFDDIVIMTGKKGASRNDDLIIGPNELEEVQEYIKSLNSPERLEKYIGLTN